MNRTRRALRIATLLTLTAGPTAALSPQMTLSHCQEVVQSQATTFITAKVTAVEACLQKISSELLQKHAANADLAASTCVTQFRKIHDTRGQGKTLSEKYISAVRKKCEPGQPLVNHTLADITGKAIGLPQQIDTLNIDAWCTRFGGDGSIDSVAEWSDCVLASAECSVDAALTTQYPRALEWLDLVRPAMLLVSSSPGDPMRSADAVAGLDLVRGAIAGPGNGSAPNIQCGRMDFPATGQTTPSVIGDDSTVKAGAAFQYHDNADGTITDVNTGLTWEKKLARDTVTNAADLHDTDNCYPWEGTCSGDGTTECATDADCTIAGGTCDAADCQAGSPAGQTAFEWLAQLNAANFAGQHDWRLPNVKELQSILNYAALAPMVNQAFNGTSCGAGCIDLTDAACSCTAASGYWTSTPDILDATFTWSIDYQFGTIRRFTQQSTFRALRAVRGGL